MKELHFYTRLQLLSKQYLTSGSSLHVFEKAKDGTKRNIVIRGQGPMLGQSNCSAIVRRMGPEVTVAIIGALLAEQRVIIAGGSVTSQLLMYLNISQLNDSWMKLGGS